MSRGRLLVIDACIGKALAARLRDRGRNAVSTSSLGLAKDVKDPELLRGLAALYDDSEDWVLITGDDSMPAEHGPVIHETAATIATILPEWPEDVSEYQWLTDVIHRQVHVIQEQAPLAVRRYTLNGSRVWRPRRRHVKLIRQHGWTPWTPEAE